MARIPDYSQRQVGIRPVGAQGFSMQAPDASGLTQGLRQAESGIMRYVEREREQADTAFTMETTARMESVARDIKFNRESGLYNLKGKAALDVTNTGLDRLNKAWDQAMQSATNDRQRSRLAAIRAAQLKRESDDLNRYEFGEREAYKTESEDALIQSSLDGAALYHNNPERIAHYQQIGAAAIHSRATRRGMSEEGLQLEMSKFNSDLAEGVIQLLPPEEQMNLLARDDGMGNLLEPARRMAMQRSAVQQAEANLRLQLAKEDRAYRMQERRERELLEEATKVGDQLLANGELSEEWIEENRNTLGASEYRYFYKQLRDGGNLNTDPQAYADLRIRASQGEDVRGEARERVRRGDLSLTDYDKLVNASESNSPQSSVPNVYKRGETFIRNSLRVSDINPDPAAAQRLASALDDWGQWVIDNPDATENQSREQYQRINREYELIGYQDMVLTKRLPRFSPVGRNEMNLESLTESMRAAGAAFDRGEITRQEFDDQAALAGEWEEALLRLRASESRQAGE